MDTQILTKVVSWLDNNKALANAFIQITPQGTITAQCWSPTDSIINEIRFDDISKSFVAVGATKSVGALIEAANHALEYVFNV